MHVVGRQIKQYLVQYVLGATICEPSRSPVPGWTKEGRRWYDIAPLLLLMMMLLAAAATVVVLVVMSVQMCRFMSGIRSCR